MFRRERLLVVIAALVALSVTVGAAAADSPLDWEVPDGWFFTQTGGEPYWGYAVTDEGGIPYWTFFKEAGGWPQLGYPVSRRWMEGEFTYQAFQKAVLQWQPGVGMFYVNIYDRMHEAGLDDWLDVFKNTPRPRDFPEDEGQPWEVVKENHLALLDENPAIKAKWYENENWLDAYGLPRGYEDRGDVRLLLAQRVVLQQWMVDVSWAAAGEVVLSNGGDIYKEAGLVPEALAEPHLLAAPACQVQETVTFVHDLTTRFLSFETLVDLAMSTPRFALFAPVSEMVKVQVDLLDTSPPDCAHAAHQAFAGWVDAEVALFRAFMAQEPDSEVALLLVVAALRHDTATRRLEQARTLAGMATAF